MSRILVSLAIIGVVSAIVIGGTISYFSDTETSSGNTFTAGSIDLKVDNECSYNGMKCICMTSPCYWDLDKSGNIENDEKYDDNKCFCTWDEKDLTENDLFVNFTDLKPGDWGEDTISFHVYSNDAWLCADIKIIEDNDVTCTEPETESTDPSCSRGVVGDGELDNYLTVFAWADMCQDNDGHTPGDNIYTPNCDGDKPLMTNPVKLTDYEGTFPIADTTFSIAGQNNNGWLPLTGSEDYYIGKAWCFGDMTIECDGTIKCDGKNVQNDAQTDKLKLDVSFEAVQARNNDDFICSQKDYGKGKEYTLELENKDGQWNPKTGDGIKGTLTFKSPYDTFDYHLTVQGLQPTTSYSLIYYKDPWPGVGSIRIGQFTTDSNGDADVSDDPDIHTDLYSAKIWVILSDDWDEMNHQMTDWHPEKYLFEMNLINYEDSND